MLRPYEKNRFKNIDAKNILKIFFKKVAYSISVSILLVIFYSLGGFLLLPFVEAMRVKRA